MRRFINILVVTTSCLFVQACTTIDRVNVNTVAVNCDVERADDKSGAAEADANVLQQAGQAVGQFVGSLRSSIVCRDVAVETQVEGTVEEEVQ